MTPARGGIRRAPTATYEQLDEIIRTESTFNFGSFVVDEVADVLPAALVPDVLDVIDCSSSVPVISTLWPTCDEIFESSVSRRYRDAVLDDIVPAVPALVVPPPVVLVPLALALLDIDALASTQRVVAPLVPLVPVVPPPVASLPVARSTHPVIFSSLPASDVRVDCVG